MPTLDDAPTIPVLTGVSLTAAGDSADVNTQLHELDLIQVFDKSTSRVKTTTVRALATALGITI
jgi:hypothetical protein